MGARHIPKQIYAGMTDYVKVLTQGDFDSDAGTCNIGSELVSLEDLEVELDFPYPPKHNVTKSSDFEIYMGTYEFPLNHTPTLVAEAEDFRRGTARIYKEMDETTYFINLRWPSPVWSTGEMSFAAHFSLDQETPALPSTIRKHNTAGWNQYWNEGDFVDLTESSNPAAAELQRRTILTQYHMGFNSAATGQPPQESDLVYNGWWGRFHLEMAVWHCTHWSTWGRQQYSDNIFPPVYETLMPTTVARTQNMGWEGARCTTGHYDLGPPTKDVTESSGPLHTKNLAYKIAYWRWGLDTDASGRLEDVRRDWEAYKDEQMRGWARLVLAINAAPVGHQMNNEYWTFDDAGYAYRSGPSPSPPPYFPGAASFLYAIGYMAVGWDGSEGHAPGFPKDGSWVVKHQGVLKAL
ncbi:hypothetical protein DL767_010867 [Monosporascus sp. MG133]|nr:hypothetical protein DL767_010867 [Monosporascus sp. MG133]